MDQHDKTTIVLWRHGETDWNAGGRSQGQADIPLNERGLTQAVHGAQGLAQIKPDAIWSSPLSRARVTAQYLADITGHELHIDDRLVEVNVGSWSGKTFEEIRAIDPTFGPDRAAGIDRRYSDEGETSAETGERMAAAVRDIVAAHPGQTVVVASHGTAIRMCVATLLGWDFATAQSLGAMLNCGWSILDFRGDHVRLKAWNREVGSLAEDIPLGAV